MNSTTFRQLKIDLITSDYNPIIEWFSDIWFKLSMVEANVYHNDGDEFIYYISNDPKQWIFFRDDKNNKFWCNHTKYWVVFDSKFNITYTDIQAITKILVENALNASVKIPYYMSSVPVENALNNAVIAKPHAHNQEILHTINVVIPTPRPTLKFKVERTLNNNKDNE